MKRHSKVSLLAIVIALLAQGSMAPTAQRKEGPEVANTWTNRLTGDAFLPEEQRYARSNMRASLSRKETPLQPSGLLGPVRIILAKHVKL